MRAGNKLINRVMMQSFGAFLFYLLIFLVQRWWSTNKPISPITIPSSSLLHKPETESPISSANLIFSSLCVLNEMQELKRPTRRRGFYVKMRLLHKNGRQQDKNSCFRYYKWVLWLSLTLYFFSSYFISHKPIPLSKTHFSKSKSNLPSRALIESINATVLQQPTNIKGLKFSNFSYVVLCFYKFCTSPILLYWLFFFLYFNRVFTGFEDIYLRIAIEIQHRLAFERALQQPFVCFRGSNS